MITAARFLFLCLFVGWLVGWLVGWFVRKFRSGWHWVVIPCSAPGDSWLWLALRLGDRRGHRQRVQDRCFLPAAWREACDASNGTGLLWGLWDQGGLSPLL